MGHFVRISSLPRQRNVLPFVSRQITVKERIVKLNITQNNIHIEHRVSYTVREFMFR